MNGIDQMFADVVRADVMPTDSEIALVVRCGKAVERVAARRALQAAARAPRPATAPGRRQPR